VDFDGFKSPEINRTQWILAKIKAHSGVSTSNSEAKFDYADIEFETLRGQVNLNGAGYSMSSKGVESEGTGIAGQF
jgi:hypothetical protein